MTPTIAKRSATLGTGSQHPHHARRLLPLACALALTGFAVGLPLAQAQSSTSPEESPPANLIVQTQYGAIEGKLDDGVREFLGIPYAAPPVGGLRWRPPHAPTPWSNVRSTVAYGNTCPQTNTLGAFAAPSTTEDCLYLNVFAPGQSTSRKLPVMVWIHGGGLFDGASNPYDGSSLVESGNVLVVTLNYRLNIFGFMAIPALDTEGHKFGNYGFMDQQFALKWVKHNIAAFGGDPNNVTIFGESSGGQSVVANLVSPTAHGLFDRAIIESGAITAATDLHDAEAADGKFVQDVGCEGNVPAEVATCLRSLSVQQIQADAASFSGGQPVIPIDGTILTEAPLDAFKDGNYNHVPLMDGTNQDEYRFFVALSQLTTGHVLQPSDYSTVLSQGDGLMPGFGSSTPQIMREYPLRAFHGSASLAYSAVITDSVFTCPALTLNRIVQKSGTPVYAYEFADHTAPVYAPPVSFPYGAYHTGEIQYLFAGYHGATGTEHPLDAAQQKLADAMMSYPD